jgi:NAD-dependent dihydropyrimidine dehydrogenase PreA subunit
MSKPDKTGSGNSKADNIDSGKEESCMRQKKEYTVSMVSSSVTPIVYNPDRCIGCNRCVQVCQCDILFPSEEKGEHPIVMYPGECYYCGACVMVCPTPGAITLKHPLMNRAKFV